jgi:ABC-type antimicrobial peptide transport system permease subunit
VGTEPVEVIGIVGDVRYASLDAEPVPEVYLPEGLFPQDEVGLVVRSASDPVALTGAIREAIHEVERDVFIGPFRAMDEVIAESVSERRFMMALLSSFSITGLLLAVAGIAGIVSYSLSLRIREVGIRVAMGAGPRDVILLVSRQGLVPALIGVALGLMVAFGLTRFLAYLLYTVSPYDPAVFALALAGLATVSVITAAISAYRACRVDASSLLKS